jgi:ferredoxin-thioredoxin reductase catalytic subunit
VAHQSIFSRYGIRLITDHLYTYITQVCEMGKTLCTVVLLIASICGVKAFSCTIPSNVQRRCSRLPRSVKVEDMSPEEHAIAMEKATKAMTAFTNKYLALSSTKLCADKSVPAVVIKGLAEHKVTLGAPLCPCRFYDDKEAEAKDGFWNCPCVPMRERSECHCMLFLNEDNQFAGQEVNIDYDEVITLAQGMDV